MSEPTMQAVMERLERMERELRLWKRVGAACAVALVLIVAMGATGGRVPDEIRAKRFVVSDDDGKSYAALQLYNPSSKGALPSAMLAFYQMPSGRQVLDLGLGLAGDIPQLNVIGNVANTATLTAGGLNVVNVAKNGAMLGADGLMLQQDASNPLDAAIAYYGFSSVKLMNKGKGNLLQSRASFGLLLGDSPSFVLSDSDGKPRAVLGSYGLETIKTGATTRLPESSLVLFDKDGKVIWQAP